MKHQYFGHSDPELFLFSIPVIQGPYYSYSETSTAIQIPWYSYSENISISVIQIPDYSHFETLLFLSSATRLRNRCVLLLSITIFM